MIIFDTDLFPQGELSCDYGTRSMRIEVTLQQEGYRIGELQQRDQMLAGITMSPSWLYLNERNDGVCCSRSRSTNK